MITRSAPARSEVVALLDQLRGLGVDPPAEAENAITLAGEVERLAGPPDVAGWVAAADLRALRAEDVMNRLRRSVVQLHLTSPAGRGLLLEAVEALTRRAVTALAGDVDRLVDELRPGWDTAAAVVHAAAAAGIRTASTTADVIALGDTAAAAWRTLPPALAALDRAHRVRTRLLVLAGHDLDAADLGEQRWLDLAATGPLHLTHHPEEIPA